MNNHHYGDISNLNAPYDAFGVQGLGQSDPHPWRQKTQATMNLQANINHRLTSLKPPFCPILVDGELGPRTCGALAQLEMFFDDMPQVPACASPPEAIITPKEPPCPGDPSRPAPGPVAPPKETVETKGSSISPMLIGLGVAALAVGAVLLLGKKKKR